MKVRDFLKKTRCYVLVLLIPWLLILVHSIVRQSWPMGNGSILTGEAGEIYYQMYVELWNKVHNGETLFYTWNAGLGMDFLLNLFRYMMSPLTVLILIFPKDMISNMLQFGMVMKWSLTGVTMLYYLLHTKNNQLDEHKRLVSITLTMAYCLGNVMITNIAHVAWMDAIVVFPILLLLEEKMIEGKGFKRFFVLTAFCLVSGFPIAVPMILFLTIGFFLQYGRTAQKEKKYIFQYLYCVVTAFVIDLVISLPCVMIVLKNVNFQDGHGLTSIKMSLVDFFQRFFICDSLLIYQSSQPMLYCGVVLVTVAALYLFVTAGKKEKVVCITLAVLICCSFFLYDVSVQECDGISGVVLLAGSACLFTFLLIFMVLQVLVRLQSIRKWNLFVVAIVSIGAIVTGFMGAKAFLDFYVYLGSLLLCVLILLLLFFFSKKSILYKNMLVVFSVFCIGELLVNAYYQMADYNMYPIDECYYNEQSEVLRDVVSLEKGERIANVQVVNTHGMVLDVPVMAGEAELSNHGMYKLFKNLGMAVDDEKYSYCGGSPLLNTIFNVRYGMAQNQTVYSDMEKVGENADFVLFKMRQKSSLGYLVSEHILDWDPEKSSPFVVQNEFVNKAVLGTDIFEIVNPEMICESVLGMDPDHDMEAHERGEHIHGQEAVYQGEYNEVEQKTYYYYRKMFDGDVVKMSFTADGETDYFVFVQSGINAYFGIAMDDETIYTDTISSKQKTFHIGVVEKGTKITIEINAVADLDVKDILTVSCQVAAFNEESYRQSYEKLTRNGYEITDLKDNFIKGNINADEAGMMLTSIPMQEGFKVYVDGKETECKLLGGALFGVPLEKGEHQIEFVYATQYLKEGMIGTVIGLLLAVIYCIGEYYQKRSKESTVTE